MSEPLPTVRVVMALPAESDGVFEAAGIVPLYCGVGKVNAAAALAHELGRYVCAARPPPLVVNFGTAGSRVHPSGTLVGCHVFVQRDMDVRGLGFALGVTPFDAAPTALEFAPVFTDLPAAVCGSGDSFATVDSELPCDVVDMEGFALAKACWRAGAAMACAKYVSDGADHAAAKDWHENVHRAAEAFLSRYHRLVAAGN